MFSIIHVEHLYIVPLRIDSKDCGYRLTILTDLGYLLWVDCLYDIPWIFLRGTFEGFRNQYIFRRILFWIRKKERTVVDRGSIVKVLCMIQCLPWEIVKYSGIGNKGGYHILRKGVPNGGHKCLVKSKLVTKYLMT